MKSWIEWCGLIAATVLPFWNIPLMVRIYRRKSSKDASLWWALGVWVCFALMLPSGLASPDPVYKTFSITNFILFSTLVVFVVKYHK